MQPPFFTTTSYVCSCLMEKLFIAIFWYFVIIILYCKTIHPAIFFLTTYIFYSIYFIIQYNIELIFANTSTIEYWFFWDVEHFPLELRPLYAFIALFKKKITPRTSMISVFLFRKKNYSKIKVYCKQNRHFYHFINFILV